MSALTVQAIDAELAATWPLTLGVVLDFGTIKIGVRSNSGELIDSLVSYFTGFEADPGVAPDVEVRAHQGPELKLDVAWTLKEPEPGKTRIKEEYADLPDGRAVRKRLTGMVFLFGGSLNLAVGPCLENDNQVVNFINNRLIQHELDHGALLAHAAGVSLDGKGLALAGFAGMGKSTLALHLMSRGLNFVSNDRLLVREAVGKPLMRGVPKLPRINPGTALNNPDLETVIPEEERRLFVDLPRDEIWSLEHKYDVDINRCFGPGRFVLTSPLTGLGILNWQRDAGPVRVNRVDLAQRRDLLGAVRKSAGLFYQPEGKAPDDSEEAYIERLKTVEVLEISGGVDFRRAADDCLARLQEWPA